MRIRTSLLAVLVLGVAALAGPGVQATTWTVAPRTSPGDCVTAPSGTCSADYCSISAAMSSPSVVVGDTVVVMPGTYYENVLVKNRVALLGSGADVTIIDGCQLGSTVSFPINGNSQTVLSGFTIRNGLAEEGAGIFMATVTGASKVLGLQVITRNIIEGNTAVADATDPQMPIGGIGAGISVYKQSPAITNNIIRNNTATQYGGGLALDFSDALVTNNTIYGNSVTGIANGDNSGGGIDLYTLQDSTVISNNIIQGNSAAGGGGVNMIQVVGYYTNAEVLTTNLFGNSPDNCAPASFCFGAGHTNLTSDSLFVDPNNGDLSLQGGSPSIDAGDDAMVVDPLDLDGNVRIMDGDGNGTATVDMGALERCDNDPDMDGVTNCTDNCRMVANASQTDTDGDGVGDACDNCPSDMNADQADGDADTIGDVCDNCPTDANMTQSDGDADTVGDVCDNCPTDANMSQADGDADTVGDACDNCPSDANMNQADGDTDTVGDVCDNCPAISNTSQDDGDADMVGDVCDNCPTVYNPGQGFTDNDSDTINDTCDNCVGVSNPGQEDGDADSVGDVCDNCPTDANMSQSDGDSDTVGDVCDNCPATSNTLQTDGDTDMVGDVCDNCPVTSNTDQANADGDADGDVCDTCTDTDGDGFGNPGYPASICTVDNCPAISNPGQEDGDADMVGDVCDNCLTVSNTSQTDTDADTIGNACDNCPSVNNTGQSDLDADMVGDACDNCVNDPNTGQEDPDTDAVGSACDNCPDDNNPAQENFDGDSLGDACDPDDDNDTILDDGGPGMCVDDNKVACDDCAPHDPNDWALPLDVKNLTYPVVGGNTMYWDPLTSGTQVRYSVLRGVLRDVHLDENIFKAVCLQADITVTQITDTAIPPAPTLNNDMVDGFYYLVGSENACQPQPFYGTLGAQGRINANCEFLPPGL